MSSMIASEPNTEAVSAALGVLDEHFRALNARDASALAQTLHFPHYRMGRGGMKIWESSDTYLEDFFARAQFRDRQAQGQRFDGKSGRDRHGGGLEGG